MFLGSIHFGLHKEEETVDTKHLETFVKLSQTLNYQKAARSLQYSPSTLCKHVQILEEEMGVPLLTKEGRQLALTPEGPCTRQKDS